VAGDDVLVSAAGTTDLMWGDGEHADPGVTTGRDRFVLAPRNGEDEIGDFERGRDVIDLRLFAFVGVHDLGDLVMQATAAGVVVGLGGGNAVTVAGVTALDGGDFLFA
jgi:hypothetical protein